MGCRIGGERKGREEEGEGREGKAVELADWLPVRCRLIW